MIHRDIKTETEALTMQRQQGWVSDRTASAYLGNDYDLERKELAKEEKEAQVRQKKADHAGL